MQGSACLASNLRIAPALRLSRPVHRITHRVVTPYVGVTGDQVLDVDKEVQGRFTGDDIGFCECTVSDLVTARPSFRKQLAGVSKKVETRRCHRIIKAPRLHDHSAIFWTPLALYHHNSRADGLSRQFLRRLPPRTVLRGGYS